MSAELEVLAILGIFGGWAMAIGVIGMYGFSLVGFGIGFLGIFVMILSGKYLRGDFTA